MKLKTIRIENFRSFKDQAIGLNDYTCFVGPNGAGKSNVLVALNIFFRNVSQASTDLVNLSEEDFHNRDTSKSIRITLTFGDIEAEAAEALRAYVRQDQLVVSAVAEFDASTQRAPVRQIGSRLVIKLFSAYFLAQEGKAKAAELREIYEGIRAQVPALPPPGSMDAMRSALRDYEEAHPELCELVEAETQFYGWSKGDNLLRRFVQWVCLPAVKDPTSEQEEGRTTALGAILERTIRTKVEFDKPLEALRKEASIKYQDILEKEQGVLDALTKSLTNRLQVWAHESTKVSLNWYFNDQKSIQILDPLARLSAGEHDFLGELGRLGHGLQRSLLVALLQELAETNGGNAQCLILGFEEPELYQHPPQARHMASVLEALADKQSQVLVTTHSPYFVSAKGFPRIRMVRSSLKDKASLVSQYSHEELSAALATALKEAPRSPTGTMAAVEQIMQPSQNELFFTRVAVLVEGQEDVAFLSTYLTLLEQWHEFRRLGCHFVIAGGKPNLSRPLGIANGLSIPTFAMFDCDAEKDNQAANKRDNSCLFELSGVTSDPMPRDAVISERVAAWPNDISTEVKREVSAERWAIAEEKCRKVFGYDGVKSKNLLMISATLEELWKSEVRVNCLDRVCKAILEYAKKAA